MKVQGRTITGKMVSIALVCAVMFTMWAAGVPAAYASVRIKEIAQFEGARDNQLIGYGIVVGLNGTGDKGKSVFTVQAVAGILQRLGLKISGSDISVKNAAAVMITATLPPFVKNGTRIDVTLSSLGDAKSLAGGILLQTPLQGPDGVVYAVAQGSVSIGGMESGSQSSGFTTVARIPDGALVEREVPVTMVTDGKMKLLLAKNDFTTAARIAEAVNVEFGEVLAQPEDGGAVAIRLPGAYTNDVVKFVSQIERLDVEPDYQSKIVVNERTGTIVGGRDVRISTVSLTHANIHIQVESDKKEAVATRQKSSSLAGYSDAFFEEGAQQEASPAESDEVSVGDLVKYLNSLGIAPKDIIAILQSIKAAGAIQADVLVV